MSEQLTVDEVAEAMFKMINAAAGVRKLKPTDVSKAMVEHYGADRCSKELCKEAIRQLVDSGRCIYTYFGGSYIEVPRPELEQN